MLILSWRTRDSRMEAENIKDVKSKTAEEKLKLERIKLESEYRKGLEINKNLERQLLISKALILCWIIISSSLGALAVEKLFIVRDARTTKTRIFDTKR
jgi:hypothetical protein